jgi:hypothetical protein
MWNTHLDTEAEWKGSEKVELFMHSQRDQMNSQYNFPTIVHPGTHQRVEIDEISYIMTKHVESKVPLHHMSRSTAFSFLSIVIVFVKTQYCFNDNNIDTVEFTDDGDFSNSGGLAASVHFAGNSLLLTSFNEPLIFNLAHGWNWLVPDWRQQYLRRFTVTDLCVFIRTMKWKSTNNPQHC